MHDLDASELRDERRGISGLDFLERVGGTDACPIHRYSFPEQDLDVRSAEEAIMEGGDRLGAFESVEPARRLSLIHI